MKRFLSIAIVSLFVCSTAHADRIVILDENNNVKQEIYTQSMNTSQPVAPQPVYVQPQQVVVTQPVQTQEVVVVRPRPVVRSYYYDPVATTLFAGFTGAVIGGALFHHGHHHRHHHGGHRRHR